MYTIHVHASAHAHTHTHTLTPPPLPPSLSLSLCLCLSVRFTYYMSVPSECQPDGKMITSTPGFVADPQIGNEQIVRRLLMFSTRAMVVPALSGWKTECFRISFLFPPPCPPHHHPSHPLSPLPPSPRSFSFSLKEPKDGQILCRP